MTLGNAGSDFNDRTPLFTVIRQFMSAEIRGKIIQLQNLPPEMESANFRKVSEQSHFRNNERISRILIYRRHQLKLRNDEWCFQLIWNEPNSSNVWTKWASKHYATSVCYAETWSVSVINVQLVAPDQSSLVIGTCNLKNWWNTQICQALFWVEVSLKTARCRYIMYKTTTMISLTKWATLISWLIKN